MSAFSKAPPKHWFDLVDAFGGEWTVHLGDSESIPQMGSDYGVTLEERHLVGIDGGQPHDVIMMTALHEAMHICASSPGDVHVLAQALGCDQSKVASVEETFVSFLAPRLYALLSKNGFLKLPKVPR